MIGITMKEIAKLAGVSKSTVSRALHASHLVSPKTRHHILRLMEEKGYVYNSLAGELSRKKSTTIGLVAPTIRYCFGTTILTIVERAEQYGLSVVLGNTGFDFEKERRILRRFQERHVAGLILLGFIDGQESLLKELSRQGIPIVVTWDVPDGDADNGMSYVGFDNYKGACTAMEYLISLNHRRIGLILGPYSKARRIRRRFDGYRESLDRHGIPYDPSLVLEREPNLISGREAMGRLLQLSNPPTAVVTGNDELGIGAVAAIKDRGLRVPEDISVVGFDDIEFSAFSSPSLTTIRAPEQEIGEIALKVLSEMMTHGSKAVVQHRLDADLVIRQSCCRARQE
jgi:DNA-binding LacI/PurR family transcriptional regulator